MVSDTSLLVRDNYYPLSLLFIHETLYQRLSSFSILTFWYPWSYFPLLPSTRTCIPFCSLERCFLFIYFKKIFLFDLASDNTRYVKKLYVQFSISKPAASSLYSRSLFLLVSIFLLSHLVSALSNYRKIDVWKTRASIYMFATYFSHFSHCPPFFWWFPVIGDNTGPFTLDVWPKCCV